MNKNAFRPLKDKKYKQLIVRNGNDLLATGGQNNNTPVVGMRIFVVLDNTCSGCVVKGGILCTDHH